MVRLVHLAGGWWCAAALLSAQTRHSRSVVNEQALVLTPSLFYSILLVLSATLQCRIMVLFVRRARLAVR